MSDVERELPDQWPDDVTHCPPAMKMVMGLLVPPDVMADSPLQDTDAAEGPEAEQEHEHENEQEDVPIDEVGGPLDGPLVTMLTAAGPPALPPARRLTAKELVARKQNAQFAGVKTPEGKAISRLNARKHGVFASALTPLDHLELAAIYDEFAETAQPVGAIEEALVEKMALCWLRLQRCARAEAELHADVWLPTVRELRDAEDGRDEPWRRADRSGFFKPHTFERLVSLVHRYDTSLTNQMMRLMHELERVQRRRTGDLVGPPVSADVSVTGV